MAKLPSIQKIMREDISGAPTWVDKIIYPINNFFETIYYALNKGLTFQENITSIIKSVDFETKSTYVSGTFGTFDTIKINNTMNQKPEGIIILQHTNRTLNSKVESPIITHWTYFNNNLIIYHISGLTASNKYTFNLLII